MSTPMDDQAYGGSSEGDERTVRNGNPGRPQSDYETDDPRPQSDPSDFADNSGEVIAGSAKATDKSK